MGRVRTADQCRDVKPPEKDDTKTVYCGKRRGHAGPHTAGRCFNWTSAYAKTQKEPKR